MADSFVTTRRVAIVGGLALTLGLVLAHGNQFGERFLGWGPLASRDLFWWPMLGVTLLYVVAVERRPLSSIGIRKPTWLTPLFGIGAAAVILYGTWPLVQLVLTHFHLQPQGNTAAGHAIDDMPYWYRALLVTRAALVEEVVFRGYAIERIEELTGSRWVAGVLSLAAFMFAHLSYWGWAALIPVGAAGFVFTILYLWRRDLVANIIAHFVVDGVQLLIP